MEISKNKSSLSSPKNASRLCLGSAQFGMDYGIANKDGQLNQKDIISIVDYAFRNGVKYYDTAQSYGNSEEMLGCAFAHLDKRQDLRVITKLDPLFLASSQHEFDDFVARSFDKLGLTKLWGLLLHRIPDDKSIPKIIKWIESLKSRGLIENFGITVYTPNEALCFANESWVDIIQVPFNILDRRLIDNDFFAVSGEKKKNIFIRSVFLQGLLLLARETLIEQGMAWAVDYMQIIWDYVARYSLSIEEFALQAVFQYCKDAHIIIGIDNLKQLKQNLARVNNFSIPEQIFIEWWKNLPLFPDRLLNPFLWK